MFFSRINQRLMARKRRVTTLVVEGDEIIVNQARFALTNATDIFAYESDVYAGQLLCLMLSFPSKKLVNVNQQDKCWNDLITALDRLALTELPSAQWIAEFVSGISKTPKKLHR